MAAVAHKDANTRGEGMVTDQRAVKGYPTGIEQGPRRAVSFEEAKAAQSATRIMATHLIHGW